MEKIKQLRMTNIFTSILLIVVCITKCSDNNNSERTIKKLNKEIVNADSIRVTQQRKIDSLVVVMTAKDFTIKKLEEEVGFYRERMSKPVNNTVRFVLPDDKKTK